MADTVTETTDGRDLFADLEAFLAPYQHSGYETVVNMADYTRMVCQQMQRLHLLEQAVRARITQMQALTEEQFAQAGGQATIDQLQILLHDTLISAYSDFAVAIDEATEALENARYAAMDTLAALNR
jgi:hypothetical protein